MLGLLVLLAAFIFVLLGLGSYRKRRQQQKARAFANQYHPQQVYHGYDDSGGYYGGGAQQQQYHPPPPVYNNQPGPMEAGLIQAPPPVYTPYDNTSRKAEYNNERGDRRSSKNRFVGWVRGG